VAANPDGDPTVVEISATSPVAPAGATRRVNDVLRVDHDVLFFVRRRWEAGPTVMIAVLVVLDILLVGIAWHHGRGDASAQTVTIRPASSQVSTSVTTTKPAGNASKASSKGPVVKTAAPLLSAVDSSTATLANPGCKGSPNLRVTTDGGATTHPLVAPARHILRVVQTDALNTWVIGADAKCRPTYYSTTDGGRTWSAAASLGQVWIALPGGVHTPTNGLTKPCGAKSPTPIALSPAGSANAYVVCSQSLLRTSNGGKTWHTVTGLPAGQVTDVSLTPGGTAAATVAGARGCSGVLATVTTTNASSWSTGQCLQALHSGAAVSITTSGAGLITGQGVTYTTSDGGKSWTPAA
jgi:photosystem II stability/assembly factor-like uncharacterized protein